MFIKNFKSLATNSLRKDALTILNAGLESIQFKELLRKRIKLNQEGKLAVNSPEKEEEINLSSYNRMFIVAFGKGSYRAVNSLDKNFLAKVEKGFIIDKNIPESSTNKTPHLETEKWKFFKGTHPIPSSPNLEATQKIVSFLETTQENDLVLFLIFGGGSALFTYPRISLEKLKETNRALLKSGAEISEINTIRKHLSKVKGGNLLGFAHPSQVYSLIFSDVPGDDLSTIASGPTVPDSSTVEEAKEIIQKYNIEVGESYLKETPKSKQHFHKAKNVLVASNKVPLSKMKEKAKELGYNSKIVSFKKQGEAKEVGPELLSKLQPHQVLLAGGETTVTVEGQGKGGRNQELVLSTINSLKKGQVIISCASDGFDNTPFAGAIADQETHEKVQESKLNPQKHLENNDSYHFFKQTEDGILITEGINVSDLMLFLER